MAAPLCVWDLERGVMIQTRADLNKLINASNFSTRFEVDLSVARVAVPHGIVIPARTKINGLFIVSKGTGIFTLSFVFPIKGSDIGLTEGYFLSSELSDRSSIPFEFNDLVITNTAQTVVNPIFMVGMYIDG